MSAEQRVAVVIAASLGIGAALMDGYRKQGYSVVTTARIVRQTDDTDIPVKIMPTTAGQLVGRYHRSVVVSPMLGYML
jgi:NAD(P)-dependent dehydrogenase (short-subunit alcohol dehydrogenase family)